MLGVLAFLGIMKSCFGSIPMFCIHQFNTKLMWRTLIGMTKPSAFIDSFFLFVFCYFFQLHLVHWNCESPSFSTFKDAVGSGDPNALCVLGFFLKVTF